MGGSPPGTVAATADDAWRSAFESVFLGGGTPTLTEPVALEREPRVDLHHYPLNVDLGAANQGYSEIRSQATSSLPRIEMFAMGG